jgi:hypothetical protein
MFGFPMLARAWFSIILCTPFSLYFFDRYCVFATMFMSTLIFILFMFLVAMFIICFGYMSNIVRLLLIPCVRSYSAHPTGPWVSGRHYVSVVLRYCLSTDASYVPGRVVDCRRDRSIESYVVHPPCVGYLVEPGLEGDEDYDSKSP